MRYYRKEIPPAVYRLLTHRQGLQQRTDEWIKARLKYITASEVASAVGENKCQSVDEYVRQKAGHAPRFAGNFATEWGTRYEPEAQALYEQRTGEILLEFGLMPHPTVPFLAGSPDGVTLSGRLVEIKCPLRRKIGDGSCPQHYIGQVQLLMAILDLDVCDFVQYRPATLKNPTMEFTIVQIPRDRDWLPSRMAQLEDVHRRILALAQVPVSDPVVVDIDVEPTDEDAAAAKRKRPLGDHPKGCLIVD